MPKVQLQKQLGNQLFKFSENSEKKITGTTNHMITLSATPVKWTCTQLSWWVQAKIYICKTYATIKG